MRSQKQLRDELRFVTEFNTLFDVVQQTAVTQMRHLEEKTNRMRRLSEVIPQAFFPLLPHAAASHPCLRGGEKGRLLIVITSDEGLVGPLHANVIEAALERAEPPTSWLFIGQRGLRMAGPQAAGIVRSIAMPSEERVDEQLMRVKQFLLAQYRSQRLKDVWAIAPHYASMTRQEVSVRQLLPLPGGAGWAMDERLIVEPSLNAVVESLVGIWIESVLRDCFWSARRAECAARAMHAEASRQEMARHSRRVRHEFFKTLHERVDVMVREMCVVQRRVAARRLRARAAKAEATA